MSDKKGTQLPIDVRQFSKLTTSLFAAAIGQSGWDDFLAELSHQTGGTSTHIFGFDTEANISIEPILYGYDPAFIESYDDYYGTINSWAPGFAEHQQGVVVDSEAMCSTEELVKTEFYNDWVKPQGNLSQGGGAILFKNDTRFFAIGGNIRHRDTEKLKRPWLQIIGSLVPHMQQAFEMSRALAGARLESAVVAGQGLREIPAILILSHTGRIVFANNAAQLMLSEGVPISSNWRGELAFGLTGEARRISESFLRHHLTAANPSYTACMTTFLGGPTYSLRFARLTPGAQIELPLPFSLGFSANCSVLVVTKTRPTADLEALLRMTYALTASEASVAVLISNGLTADEISRQRNVSVHTVRNQLKAGMAKLGVRRQVELLRLFQEIKSSHSPFGS